MLRVREKNKKPPERVVFYFLKDYLPFRSFPTFRRETMNTFEYFFGARVFCPFPDGLPHLVFNLRSPIPCRPSPPPYGWSTGFCALPRTVGRIPNHRLRPAYQN